MHPDDEHLLVVGAVEDPDHPAGRQPDGRTPQVVVVALELRGDLERGHLDPLRVHAAHHVADRPVLPGRIHCLEDDEQAPRVLRRKAHLELGQPLDALPRSSSIRLLLPDRAPCSADRSPSAAVRPRAGLHLQRLDQLVDPGEALVGHRRLLALRGAPMLAAPARARPAIGWIHPHGAQTHGASPPRPYRPRHQCHRLRRRAIGGSWGPVDDAASLQALHAAADAGVTLIDTADVYGDGHSERLIRRFLSERSGERFIVATKIGRRLPRSPPTTTRRPSPGGWTGAARTWGRDHRPGPAPLPAVGGVLHARAVRRLR